jgi:hypothetical protein
MKNMQLLNLGGHAPRRSIRPVPGVYWYVLAAAAIWALAWPGNAGAVVSFSTFVTQSSINAATGNPSSPIGFAFAGDRFVGSVYPTNAQLYQTSTNGGSVTPFGTPIPGGQDEMYVSSSLGLGGWPSRDIYVSAGTANNGLYHFSHTGASQGPMVLSGPGAAALNAQYVKGIAFDPFGAYGFDMIVTTNSGGVFRVSSAGFTTLLATIPGQVLEGLDFAPAGFGPVGSQVVIASESASTLYAVSPAGIVTNMNAAFGISVAAAEEIGFVPLDLGLSGNPVEGFYAASYPNDIQKADASQFTGMLGDAIVTSELCGADPLTRVHWNGSAFVVITPIGNLPAQAEDGIFVTQAIINPGGGSVPEPVTGALAGLGLSALTLTLLRRRRA